MTMSGVSPGRTRMCSCRWCKEYRLVKRTVKSGSRHQLRRVLLRFAEDAWMANEELSVNQAILKGTWPSAVEILERALERAKKYQQEQSNQAQEANSV